MEWPQAFMLGAFPDTSCEGTTMCEAADGGLRVCASKQAVKAGHSGRDLAMDCMIRVFRVSVDRAGMQAAAR
jgi:hypothetical protein